MTERYAHLAPENVRAAVQRLDGLSTHGPEGVVCNAESRFGHAGGMLSRQEGRETR